MNIIGKVEAKRWKEAKEKVPSGYCKVWCISCNQFHTINADKPLREELPGHVWGHIEDEDAGVWIDEKYGCTIVRCRTYEDELDELAEREICSVCGVPHGPNPYTGCNL